MTEAAPQTLGGAPVTPGLRRAYLYVCKAHGRLGKVIRPLLEVERAALIRERHLDRCQVRGCQHERDRVILAGFAP